MKVSGDQYIIDGILQEDLQIMRSLYRDYYPGIQNFVESRNGSVEDAKDIFQDALVVIYMRARKNPFFLRTKFNTFLFAVCKILLLKEQRNSFSFGFDISTYEPGLPDLDDDIIDDMIKMEKHKLVWKHFKQLGQECQQLIKLSIDETPLEIIREILGFSSIQYTKNRKTNCKNILVRRIWNSPEYKELRNEKVSKDSTIPRW
jgi:DNA-directed RNA polymerase specialized sigma24 family protein